MREPIDIAEIKRRVAVDDVLAAHGRVNLRRTSSGRAGACPICSTSKNTKSRAFTISADGRAWYCFSACNRGGSVVDLVMALEQCSALEAVTLLKRSMP